MALAGAFAAREVVQFMSSSVKAFAEAEGIWNRLGASVDATGASFEALRPQIEGAANAMMDASRFGDDEFAAALQGLTIQTGDVEKALGLMGLAADLAAAKQLSLESAANTLGRGLAGNTTQLTRMFPALKNSTDLFGDLQKIVKGMAEKDVAGLEGQLVQMNNAWGEFKEAIGEALSGAAGGPSIINRLTDSIKGLTDWITDHKSELQEFAKTLLTIASGVGKVVAGLTKLPGLMPGMAGLVRLQQEAQGGFSGEGAGGSWGDSVAQAEKLSDAVAAAGVEEKRLAEAARDTADAIEEQTRRLHEFTGFTGFTKGPPEAHLVGSGGSAFDQAGKQLAGLRRDLVGLITDRPELPGGIRAPVVIPDKETGFLGQTFGALKGQVLGLAASFGPLAVAAAVLKPVFEGFMEAIGPALAALAEPLREVGRILGAVVTPVLELLAEPMRLIAELFAVLNEPLRLVVHIVVAQLKPAFTVLAAVLRVVTVAFSYVMQAIGWFVKGLGQFVDKIVPDWISTAGKGLAEMGQSMIDNAKAVRDGTDAVIDEATAIDTATAAAERFADSVTNLPRVLALALLRFKASTVGTGTGTGTSNPIGSPPPLDPHRTTPGGPVFSFNGPMTFNGVGDMDGVIKAVEGHVMKAGWRASTSRLASALG